jgi:hypothetical protein
MEERGKAGILTGVGHDGPWRSLESSQTLLLPHLSCEPLLQLQKETVSASAAAPLLFPGLPKDFRWIRDDHSKSKTIIIIMWLQNLCRDPATLFLQCTS